MSEKPKNQTRRIFLAGGVGTVVGFVAAAFSIPSLRRLTNLWFEIANNPKTLTNREVDLRGLEPGQTMSTIWNNRPIYIMRRTPEMLQAVKDLSPNELRFPASEHDELPPGVDPTLRSRRPEYLVVDGLCTHLGCAIAPTLPGQNEMLPQGGFFCGCHQGKFDLAGRVYSQTPPPENLPVPPHYFASPTVLVIGQNEPS